MVIDPPQCSMCKTRERVEKTVDATKGFFLWCPNCDDPTGVDPDKKPVK